MSYLDLIADDKSLITYRPRLNELTGSVLGTILLQQILHWWKVNKGKPFYKFSAPAQGNPAYKAGDSWQEELGFTRSEFETARKAIAQKRKKGEQSGDELVTYRVDINRMTWYTVNVDAVENALKSLYVVQDSSITHGRNPALEYTETTTETTTESDTPPPAKPTPKHYATMEAMEQSASLSPHVKALADAIVDVTSSLSITQNIIDVAYTLHGWDATPELVRELFSGAGCYYLTEGSGTFKNASPSPWPSNIKNEWGRALQWKEDHTSGGAWAELYAKHIAPLQSVDGDELKERVRLLPFDIKERLTDIGVKQAGQIARLSLAQFAGGA